MKKSGLIVLLALLCCGLTGCSATGGVFCGVLVVLALGILIIAFLRAQSLARFRRKRRLNKRQRAWLRTQIALTNLMYVASVALLGIGLIVGIASSLIPDAPPDDPTTSFSEEQAPTPSGRPAEQSTEASDAPDETTGSDQDGPPDLMGIPDSLLNLMENNPETTEFVLHYPDRQPMEIDLSEFDLSEGVPLFMQWDMRWGYETYGSDVLAITGCAPTCMAMVGYYLTGEARFTPDNLANFALEHDFYSHGNGTKWTFIGDGAEMLGLSSTELPLVEEVLIRNLRAGNPIIAVMGPGDFTSSGHYVVLVDYEDGLYKVNDPNRRANSERLWSYETLEPQIRNLWAIRLPMS